MDADELLCAGEDVRGCEHPTAPVICSAISNRPKQCLLKKSSGEIAAAQKFREPAGGRLVAA